MKYALVAALLATAALAPTASAVAATFVAEAKEGAVTVFSTSKAKESCKIHNTFSYVFESTRYTTTQTCNVDVLPGKHIEVCNVKDPVLSAPKIEKPVEVVSCAPQP
jgi:hypothetical protein